MLKDLKGLASEKWGANAGFGYKSSSSIYNLFI